MYSSTTFMMFAWKMKEKLVESSWMPPSGPIKTVLMVGLAIFTLQCLAQFLRDLYQLIRGKPYDTA
jgi:TRAP-type mannitol/chloroaromatic compound transport system permease small subunit